MLTPAQALTLKTELVGTNGTVAAPGAGADPTARGYLTPLRAGNHDSVAALLNATYAGASSPRLAYVGSDAIRACFMASDLTAITATPSTGAADRAWLDFALASQTVDPSRSVFATELTRIVGAAPAACRNRVLAATTQPAKRIEEVAGFPFGFIVTAADIAAALAS